MLIMTSKTFYSNIVIVKNYKYINITNELWNIIFIPCGITSAFICIILLVRFHNASKSKREKKQAKILIFSIFLSLIFTNLCTVFYPDFNPLRVNNYPVLFFIFNVYGFLYVLVKYQFLSFGISDITKEIISNVQDMIVIISPDLVIKETNSNFEKSLSCSSKELLNKNFLEQIIQEEDFKKKFDELLKGKFRFFNSKITYKSNHENIPTDSYFSRIIDKFDDFVGILVISKEIYGIKQLKKLYNITDRQFEIIQFAVDGLSNDEIGNKLNIAKRTVETHLFNIYNKIGIDNKVELIKIAKDYNFI
jgi:DNA-binding CsgD family transcriptional regulator/PAS domain-containing protein